MSKSKTASRYIAISIPGRHENDACSWFIYDTLAYRSVFAAASAADALASARRWNENARAEARRAALYLAVTQGEP